MATREDRADRGRERGRERASRRLSGLGVARRTAGISQDQLATSVGWSQGRYSRFERRVGLDEVSFVEAASVAALLGLELSAALHVDGQPIRDAGHQALIGRFLATVSAAWRVVREAPLPLPGDRRSWDLLLRLPGQLVGAEAETRIRDVQRLVRHVRERERDGGADAIVIVLSDSRANRLLVGQLREALGPGYATPPRQIWRALRTGQPLPGSGVVLV